MEKSPANKFNLQAAKKGADVRTRAGHSARIVCFDRKGHYPIIALVSLELGVQEEIIQCNKEGVADVCAHYDLVMCPVKKEAWVNVYQDTKAVTRRYPTKGTAMVAAEPGRVATVKIEWEDFDYETV